MSVRLYVGNLPKDVETTELQTLLADSGDDLSIKIVTDRKTGKCRGFAFVTVETDEAADRLIASYDGKSFKEANLKVEKAQPRQKKEGGDASEDAPRNSGNPSRRSGNKPSGRSNNNAGNTAVSTPAASSQPDPRWADALSELKQKLEAQANS